MCDRRGRKCHEVSVDVSLSVVGFRSVCGKYFAFEEFEISADLSAELLNKRGVFESMAAATLEIVTFRLNCEQRSQTSVATKQVDSRHGKKFRKPQTLDHEDRRSEVEAVCKVRQAALCGREERSA